MFNRSTPREKQLERENQSLTADLKAANKTIEKTAAELAEQKRRVDRLADDRIKAARADGREMARLQDVAETWAKLARADERDSTLAERDAAIAELQDRLDGDRAIKSPVPRKDSAELRAAKAHAAALEALVHTLQTANMAQDVRRPSLQKAS